MEGGYLLGRFGSLDKRALVEAYGGFGDAGGSRWGLGRSAASELAKRNFFPFLLRLADFRVSWGWELKMFSWICLIHLFGWWTGNREGIGLGSENTVLRFYNFSLFFFLT
jgi:hypothetical protein